MKNVTQNQEKALLQHSAIKRERSEYEYEISDNLIIITLHKFIQMSLVKNEIGHNCLKFDKHINTEAIIEIDVTVT